MVTIPHLKRHKEKGCKNRIYLSATSNKHTITTKRDITTGWKKMFQAYGPKKQSGEVILLSDIKQTSNQN